MVEETTKRCVLWRVNKRNEKTLSNIIINHISSNSTIKSDQWTAYRGLGKRGFRHLTVNHSVSFVAEDGTHTQLIESLWSQVKAGLKLKRGTSARHLSGYLDLYSFICDAKYQNRSPIDYFITLIQAENCY